jgi:hypothetical protein
LDIKPGRADSDDTQLKKIEPPGAELPDADEPVYKETRDGVVMSYDQRRRLPNQGRPIASHRDDLPAVASGGRIVNGVVLHWWSLLEGIGSVGPADADVDARFLTTATGMHDPIFK